MSFGMRVFSSGVVTGTMCFLLYRHASPLSSGAWVNQIIFESLDSLRHPACFKHKSWFESWTPLWWGRYPLAYLCGSYTFSLTPSTIAWPSLQVHRHFVYDNSPCWASFLLIKPSYSYSTSCCLIVPLPSGSTTSEEVVRRLFFKFVSLLTVILTVFANAVLVSWVQFSIVFLFPASSPADWTTERDTVGC